MSPPCCRTASIRPTTILPPLDLWSIHGMQRDLSRRHYPAYANDLWEAVQQAATAATMSARRSSVSRLSGGRSASVRAAKTLLLLMEVGASNPGPLRIADFVAAGGREIAIGRVPTRARIPRYRGEGCLRRRSSIVYRDDAWPDRFVRVDAPQWCIGWYRTLQAEYGLTLMRKSPPRPFMMMNYYKSGDKDIYFVVNSSIERSMQTRLEFPPRWRPSRPGSGMPRRAGGMLDVRNGTLGCACRHQAEIHVFEKDCGGQMPAVLHRSANPLPQRHLGYQGHAPYG